MDPILSVVPARGSHREPIGVLIKLDSDNMLIQNYDAGQKVYILGNQEPVRSR